MIPHATSRIQSHRAISGPRHQEDQDEGDQSLAVCTLQPAPNGYLRAALRGEEDSDLDGIQRGRGLPRTEDEDGPVGPRERGVQGFRRSIGSCRPRPAKVPPKAVYRTLGR